jgi:hypothetical protein
MTFPIERAIGRLRHAIRAEAERCPREHRAEFLRAVQKLLQKLLQPQIGGRGPPVRRRSAGPVLTLSNEGGSHADPTAAFSLTVVNRGT